MAYTLFSVPSAKRAELDEVLKEDRVARQSQKVREAQVLGGPAGELYVLIEGAPDAVALAEERLAKIGTRPNATDREKLKAQFQAEDEAASVGMGLLFTEG
jgi:hypothetical protein